MVPKPVIRTDAEGNSEVFASIKEAAAATNVNFATVSRICHNKEERAKGFTFSFYEEPKKQRKVRLVRVAPKIVYLDELFLFGLDNGLVRIFSHRGKTFCCIGIYAFRISGKPYEVYMSETALNDRAICIAKKITHILIDGHHAGEARYIVTELKNAYSDKNRARIHICLRGRYY